RNIKKIIASLPNDTLIIPGHGSLSDMQGLNTYYDMLSSTIRYVQQQVAEGKSLAEIQLAGLPTKWAVWGGGFVTEKLWIKAVYQSLAK
ncbi:MAG: hypothetical protein RPR40_13185, partial [Bermanella sp.]